MKNLKNIITAALIVSCFAITSCSNCSAYGCYTDQSENRVETLKNKMELKKERATTIASCTP